LNNPQGLLFGPDANGDGVPDLYVTSCVLRPDVTAQPGTSVVLRYDGRTGAVLGTFVTPDSGGLSDPTFLTFTETDPTTLAYRDTQNPRSAAVPQLGSFTASPNKVPAGSSVTLTAANVVALNPGSTVTQVAFYQDSNGDSVLQPGTD